MTEQSQFSKFSKKHLLFIAEKLIDAGFPNDNPYYDNEYDEHFKELQSIGKYFNVNVVDEDVQFFAKFLYINDGIIARLNQGKSDILSYEDLIIPVAKTYNLHYTVWGSCSYEEYKSQKFDAYDKDWVADSANQQRNDGNWDLYDGVDRRESEYDNFEESDHSFGDVYEVNEDGTYKIRESILDRLVLENTSEVVSSLDKQTLLKLKQIIESRLRSL